MARGTLGSPGAGPFDPTSLPGAVINATTYGAVGDGSTDDTEAIQAALDAADGGAGVGSVGHIPDEGGNVVFLPEGRYVVDSLTISHGVVLQGAGERATFITGSASGTGAILSLSNTDRERIVVRDLTINGNKANRADASVGISFVNSAGSGQHGDASGFPTDTFVDPGHLIERVTVVSCGGDGVSVSGRGLTTLRRMFVVDNSGDGITMAANDCEIISCVVGFSGECGIKVTGSNCRIVGSKAYYSGKVTPASGDGFRITATGVMLSSCESQDNTRHGFAISGSSSVTGESLIADANNNNYPVSSANETSGQSGSGFYFFDAENCTVSGASYSRFTPTFTTAAVGFGGTSNTNIKLTLVAYNNSALVNGSNYATAASRNSIEIHGDTSSLSHREAPLTCVSPAAATVPLSVKGAPSQSGELTSWKDSAGTQVASITSTGAIRHDASSSGTAVEASMVTGDSVLRFIRTAGGILDWGSGAASRDTNLYRSAANLLKTDDKFVAALGIGVGNSAAATTLGSVTKKVEVFDASGTSLGFVPVYDAIT